MENVKLDWQQKQPFRALQWAAAAAAAADGSRSTSPGAKFGARRVGELA